jgi:hypothetical protein
MNARFTAFSDRLDPLRNSPVATYHYAAFQVYQTETFCEREQAERQSGGIFGNSQLMRGSGSRGGCFGIGRPEYHDGEET